METRRYGFTETLFGDMADADVVVEFAAVHNPALGNDGVGEPAYEIAVTHPGTGREVAVGVVYKERYGTLVSWRPGDASVVYRTLREAAWSLVYHRSSELGLATTRQ